MRNSAAAELRDSDESLQQQHGLIRPYSGMVLLMSVRILLAILLWVGFYGCGGDDKPRQVDAGEQIDGSLFDGGVLIADAGPPGEPTVTAVSEFASGTFRQSAVVIELADGRVLVGGGLIFRTPEGGTGHITGQEAAEIYDPTELTISAVDPLQLGRAGASAVLLADGKVLVTGGVGESGTTNLTRDTAELFDPSDNSFSLLVETMQSQRSWHGSYLLSSGPHAGKVLLIGGASIPEIFDPEAGSFTALGAVGVPPFNPGTPILLKDERVLLVGARSEDDADYQDCYVYDPSTEAYTKLTRLAQNRTRYPLALLNDGRVLIAGGYVSAGLTQVEIFDPTDDSISVLPQSLLGPRYLHSAAVLPSGRTALISGVAAPGDILGTVEIFDPETGSFSLAEGTVGVARSNSTALPLSDGRIFVIGGQVILGVSGTAYVSNVDIISER